MRAASFLGFEEFLTLFILFLHLAIETRLARLYTILMGAAFYVVGFAKAFLCLPRPRLPFIRPLEAALDWALPSNHAMTASCLPLYVWFYTYLHKSQLGLNSAHCVAVCCLMCTWSVLVMFSRLYLGVHSPADIVTGGILGGLLLSLYLQVDDQIDIFISQRGMEPIICYLICVLFLVSIFPATDSNNPCCGDAMILLGCVFGVVCSSKDSTKVLFSEMSILSLRFWLRVAFRLGLTAVAIMGLLKPIVKGAVKPAISSVYEFLELDHYSASEHIRETKKNPHFRYAKHLQPKFCIPPVHLTISRSDQTEADLLGEMADKRFAPCLKWNRDLPINFITYSVLQYAVCEYSIPLLELLEASIF